MLSGFLVSLLRYFVAGGRGYLACTSSSVDSTSINIGASMNLHSGFRLAVVLRTVWGQIIYVLLVSFLMGSGPTALNTCPVAVISHICCFYVKVIYLGIPPYV